MLCYSFCFILLDLVFISWRVEEAKKLAARAHLVKAENVGAAMDLTIANDYLMMKSPCHWHLLSFK